MLLAFSGFRTPPRIPTVSIPEDAVVDTARALCYEINRAFTVLREVALGRDLKKFLSVSWLGSLKVSFQSLYLVNLGGLIDIFRLKAVAGLWFLSVLGSCCDFLTLFYIGNASLNSKVLLNFSILTYLDLRLGIFLFSADAK